MNPTRLTFIRSVLCRHFRRDPCSVRPFEGLKIVDVGCGGGIPSEPLARVGATVTGIDAVKKNIKIAQLHAVWNFSKSNILFLQFRTLYRPWSALRHFRHFSDGYSPPLSPVHPPPPSLLSSEPQTTDAIDNKVARVFAPSSLNKLELTKFSAIADTWWDSEGPFKPLHVMNPTRLTFIRSVLCRHFRRDPCSVRPFEGLKIVDVGCGGGILSEPLARMGATVIGIDAVEKNIKIARLHADLDPVTSSIEYCCTTAEKLVEETRTFDAVISLEVIEHVADPAEFCKSLAALCVNDGATVISTINRSMRSYATAIIAAEYILHWLPKGTHRWSSFLAPEELVLILQRSSISVEEMAGFVFNPLTGQWSLSDDISVNFIAFGTKKDN